MLPHMDVIRNTAFQRETHTQCCEMHYLFIYLRIFNLSEMRGTVKVMWNLTGVRFDSQLPGLIAGITDDDSVSAAVITGSIWIIYHST